MALFIFRGKSRGGDVVTDRVEAVDLGQARYFLETRGWRDIEFFSDENAEVYDHAARAGTGVKPVDPELWTAEQEVAAYTRVGIAAKLWWAFKQNFIVLGPLLFWNFWSIRGERPFGFGDWAGFVCTGLFSAYCIFLSIPMVMFNRILETAVWCDWGEMRRTIRWTRRLRWLGLRAIPESELDIREASADAAEGRLDEALLRLEKYRDNGAMAPHLFQGRLAGVYESAERFPEMLACMEKAVELAPAGGTDWIDVAMARLSRFRDVEGGKAALAHIEDKELAVLPKTVRRFCEGMIACEEKADARAKEALEEVLEALTAFAGNPLIHVWEAEVKGYLAISMARLGEKAAGRALLQAARPMLVAQKRNDLVRRVEEALAGAIAATAAQPV